MSHKSSFGQRCEQFWPYISGAVVALLWLSYFYDHPLPSKIEELVKAMINVFAVFIGFLATALALLFAIDDRSVIRFLKQNFLYRRFVRFFFEGIVWSIFALISSSALIIHNFAFADFWTKFFVNIWFLTVCIAVFTCIRVFRMLAFTLHKQIESDEGIDAD